MSEMKRLMQKRKGEGGRSCKTEAKKWKMWLGEGIVRRRRKKGALSRQRGEHLDSAQ
jgi:hypothetical protein